MPFPDFVPSAPVFLREVLARHRDRPAIVLGDRRLSYADLESASSVLARALLANGVGKGTRIGLLFPNGPDWVVGWLAATRIGAVAVPINTFQQPRELAWMLRHADVDTLLGCDALLGHDYLERLEACAPGLVGIAAPGARLLTPELPYLRRVVVWGGGARGWSTPAADFLTGSDAVSAAHLRAVEDDVTPADLMVVLYSSGSSGPPKGAMHTHGSIIRHAYNLNRMRDLRSDDVVYSPMPFFWVGGLVFTLTSALHAGASLVCEERFEPGQTLALLERERVTIAMGWPHFAKAMAEHPSRAERKLSIRGGNLYDLLPGAEDMDPGLRANSLGMTETCGPHTFDRMDQELGEARRGSFGRSVPGLEHRVVDPESGALRAANESGEICVRGYSLAQGLYKREREEVFEPDGFFRTGDGGRFGQEGDLFFEGRIGEGIKTAGANVTPREVEIAIESIEGVKSAFVVGVKHAERGENVAAAIVVERGCSTSPETLRTHLKRELSVYKVPRHYWLAGDDELPMTDSGKIDKKRLRAELEARIERGEVA